jgi:hypothetical protein
MRSSEIRKEMPCLSSWKQEKIAARQNEYLRVRVRVCVCVCTRHVSVSAYVHYASMTIVSHTKNI